MRIGSVSTARAGVMMKLFLTWLLGNGIFVAFFIFGHLLPVGLFNGLYFLLFFITILCLALFSSIIIMFFIDPELTGEHWEFYFKASKPNWYYRLDFIFDVCMLVLLAGLGFYFYAIFYGLVSITGIIIRIWLNQEENDATD